MLTTYQLSELLIGTMIFLMAYIGYKFFSKEESKYYYNDLALTTFFFLFLNGHGI